MLCQRVSQNISRIDCYSFLQIILNRIMEQSVLLLCTTIKRKTNYHIHLIFAERKLLDEPIIKTANRNMFYDENGKHVRTKKEILGEDGEIREGCHIVKKGEIYEKKLFTVKDERFKSNSFLDEVKRSYTELINLYVKDENQKLQVFQRGSVYLATKKIGKRNPKALEIEADNRKRQEWNRAVDMALISGIQEPQIMEVKQKNFGADQECNFPERKKTKLICKSCRNGD